MSSFLALQIDLLEDRVSFEARSLDGPQYFYIGDSEAEEIHRTKSSALADLAACPSALRPCQAHSAQGEPLQLMPCHFH